jgi:hypothetical protein
MLEFASFYLLYFAKKNEGVKDGMEWVLKTVASKSKKK